MAYGYQYIPESSPETPSQEMARLDRENWERIERHRAIDRALESAMRESFRKALSRPLHK